MTDMSGHSEQADLLANARLIAGALEEYEFEDIAGDAAGVMNSLIVEVERSVSLTATREQVAKTLFASKVSDHAGETAPEIFRLCEEAADALFASGVLVDSSVVAAQALEGAIAVCKRIHDDPEFPDSGMGVRTARIVLEGELSALRGGGTDD